MNAIALPAEDVRSTSAEGQVELETRWTHFLNQDIDFIDSPEFETGYAGDEASIDQLLDELARGDVNSPTELPSHLSQMCESPLLSPEQEMELFREMNYLKRRAHHIQLLAKEGYRSSDMLIIAERALQRSQQIRDSIVRANLRLVISIVRRSNSSAVSFDELLSEGILVLMQTVEKFNYVKGFRFSTYAYRAITRHIYRYVVSVAKDHHRMVSNCEQSTVEHAADEGCSPADERLWSSLRAMLNEYMQHLDRREQFVIRCRYALGLHRRVRTFQSLADILGVSKERVRQLEQRAVRKLRRMAEQSQMDKLQAIA
ncbi:MAG: DNA-directed RNA polymerase sigma-70 factor [Pirellulaceae bacterium]|nr:MAG: DNA-directed RNA polymerase sigma-70 factor [Pirellulaceae bacterium]